MLKIGRKYSFVVTGMTQDGCGIGMVEGVKVFVDGALPKETVEGEIVRIEDDFAAAKLIKMENGFYERVRPVCRYFGPCGGCSLQNIKYADQLKLKRDMVCEAMERVVGIESSIVLEPIGMDNPISYRNKASYRVGMNDNIVEIGFYGTRSHNIVNINQCPMQHDISVRIKEAIREYIAECGLSVYNPQTGEGLLRHVVTRVGFGSGEAIAIIVINGTNLPQQELLVTLLNSYAPEVKSIYLNINKNKTNAVLGSECILLFGSPGIADYIRSLQFEISPLSFYQVNPAQTRVLYDRVLDYAGLAGNETVVDLYSGIGTISLYLSNRASMVYGIETIEQAVSDAKRNALLNSIDNVEFLTGKVENVLPQLWQKGVKADVVVIDPPRKGCSSRVLDTFVAMGAPRLVYVSCNPTTLARDIARLQRQGYQPVEVQPVDMFPHTAHVECVVRIQRKD